MQEDVVAMGRNMNQFVSERMAQLPKPHMPDPGRSQWHVDKPARGRGRRAGAEGEALVDPRYADAVRKERLAMQAVMEQRRCVGLSLSLSLSLPPSSPGSRQACRSAGTAFVLLASPVAQLSLYAARFRLQQCAQENGRVLRQQFSGAAASLEQRSQVCSGRECRRPC